jgi:uncharacterized iron-regulated membrane protein
MNNLITYLFTKANWLKVHLYLALLVGFLFALIGLSGSLNVYHEEIDALLNPALTIEAPQNKYQSLDKIIASVRAAHPNRYGSWTLEMPRSPHGMMTAWYEKPTETFFELYAPLMVSVNPYTGEVVTSRFWGQTVMTWLFDLHSQLRLEQLGRNTVGILGLLLLVSCASGLYLWWPSLKELLNSLKIRSNKGIKLLVLDAHRLLGLLSAVPLIVLAITGTLLSFPSSLSFFSGSAGMDHGQTGREIVSTAIPNNHPTGLASATFVAQSVFPKAELRRITTPQGDTGIYRINFRQNSEVNQIHPFSTVWVDRWSGQIREVRNPNTFSTSETFATWVWPLHTGEALGPKGRFIWFLSGISLFVLYVSGLLRWLFRTHKISDRQADIIIKQALITCQRTLYRIFYLLSRLLLELYRRLAPYVRKGYHSALISLNHTLLKIQSRRKRLGKDN